MVPGGALFLLLALTLGSRARLETSATTARIGEPFVLTIVVEHPTGASVTLPDPNTLPRSLALIEDLGSRREVDAQAEDRTTTRARWRVMALEGGDLVLPAMRVTVESAGKKDALDVETVPFAVAHALLEREDAARPAKGFRDAPAVRAVSPRALALWLGAGLLLLIAGLVVWRRRRTKPVPSAAPTALELLDELEQRLKSHPACARDVTFELTALVRRSVDEHVLRCGPASTGQPAGADLAPPRSPQDGPQLETKRAALTDADWERATSKDERVPPVTRAFAVKFLRSAERVKYAVETPSILGLREALSEARVALTALTLSEKVAA